MKLIDADSLPRHGNRGGLVNWYDIEKAPTVELTRCKDCKHHCYANKIPYCNLIDYGYGWEDNDFCSRAERKE